VRNALAALGLALAVVVVAVVTAPVTGAALLGLAVLVGLGAGAAGVFSAAGMDRGQARRAAADRATEANAGHGIAAPGWRAAGRLGASVAWAAFAAGFAKLVDLGINADGGREPAGRDDGDPAPFRDRVGAAWGRYRPPLAASGHDGPAAPGPGAAGASRRLDGKPETDADRRFFDERASGYTGPLDQDGNRADDPRLPFAPAGEAAQPTPPPAEPPAQAAPPAPGPAAAALAQEKDPAADTHDTRDTTNQEEHMPTTPAPRHKGQRADAPGADVAEYAPETLSELLEYCANMAKANHAMSEATADFTETLTGAIGLDEQAVSGVAEIGEQYAEVSDAWRQAAERIRARYEQVIDAVESGVVLPHDGRFIDGDAAAA
jgi:hypothetical protein